MFDDTTIIVLVVGGVAGLFVLVLMIQISQAAEAKHIKSRLERNRARKSGGDKAVSLRLRQGGGHFAIIDELAKKLMANPTQMRDRLERTGHKLSIGQFFAFSALAGAFVATVLWLLLGLPGILLLLVFAVVTMLLPHWVIGFLIRRREKAFQDNFPEALDLIIRGLKSGLPVGETIRAVGEEFKNPVGEEFTVVTDKVKLGQSLEEALTDSTKRMDIQDYKFFVISLAVQRETGGNLAETLENLVDILRRRRQMKLKIKAMSSEAKASAIILGSLPFIMFGILMLLNYEYTALLFTDKRGMAMMGAGFCFIGTGSFVMKKMVNFEV